MTHVSKSKARMFPSQWARERNARHMASVGRPGDLELALQDDDGDVVLVHEYRAEDLKGHPEVEWSSSAQSMMVVTRPFS